MTISIQINGEPRTVPPSTVRGLLDSLGIDPVRVAVELNLDILPKQSYDSTDLNEGDRIEIVHFVGGG